jgi:hypothetical protein
VLHRSGTRPRAGLFLDEAKAAVVDEGFGEPHYVRPTLAGIARQEIGPPYHAGKVLLGRGALRRRPRLMAAIALVRLYTLSDRLREIRRNTKPPPVKHHE